MRIIEKFYKKLYAIKPSKDSAREKILNCFNKRIISRTITELSISTIIKKMKMIIQRAILKKSLENNDFFFKYHKMLTSHSKKKKKKSRSLINNQKIN